MTEEESGFTNINKAIEVFEKGGVVIFPTDTVFGIGCKVDAQEAIGRIRKIKVSRQNFPVLISSIEEAHKIAHFNRRAQQLATRFWPGGLTIITDSRKRGEKIGLRMPNSKLILEIISKLRSPIIGTSANFHSQKAPTMSFELDKRLTSLVDYVIEGECINKTESTVVDTTVFPIKILRQGAVKINGIIN